MPRIYTKTGDEGKTALIGGTRVYKNDARVECYGIIDELNAHIGLLNDHIKPLKIHSILSETQNNLFIVGSLLAEDTDKSSKMALPALAEADVTLLEKEIDKMSERLPPLKFFILPGGHKIISQAHIARTVCRRAERSCTALITTIRADAEILLIIKYLNRLSDYLFVLSRYIAQVLKVEEIKWTPKK